MEENLKFLKDNIRFYRHQKEMSQSQLAEKCGISTIYVSELEQGKKYPSLKILGKLADVFNIPVYVLLKDNNVYDNKVIEKFSSDLVDELREVIDKMKSKY